MKDSCARGSPLLEHAWAKLLLVPALALTSTVFILLLWANQNHWTNTDQFYQLVINNRATVQIIVQVLTSCFGAIHAYVPCILANFFTRLCLTRKPYTLDQLKLYKAVSSQSVEWSMPTRFRILLVIFKLLTILPAAFWADALTPEVTSTLILFSLRLPQYSNASSTYWSNLEFTSPMLSKWNGSIFTYSPNYDLQGLILNDAASATNAENLSQTHRKLDDTGHYMSAVLTLLLHQLDLPIKRQIRQRFSTTSTTNRVIYLRFPVSQMPLPTGLFLDQSILPLLRLIQT